MIIDGHCDLPYKLWKYGDIEVYNDSRLQTNIYNLQQGNVKVQFCAIWVPHEVPIEQKFIVALSMIQTVKTQLSAYSNVKILTHQRDVSQLEENQIGILLTLEGCDAIGSDLMKLRILLDLGIRSVGLTWNFANLVADGCLEKRNGGISNFGYEVIQLLNKEDCLIDVSHLSNRGFWDVIEKGNRIFASHSNSDYVCPHPRNLQNNQIDALIKQKSVIGVTFVPDFLGGMRNVTSIIRQIDYICSRGGESSVALGSDFDGYDEKIPHLENASHFVHLKNEMQKYFSAEMVDKICYKNWQFFLQK